MRSWPLPGVVEVPVPPLATPKTPDQIGWKKCFAAATEEDVIFIDKLASVPVATRNSEEELRLFKLVILTAAAKNCGSKSPTTNTKLAEKVFIR